MYQTNTITFNPMSTLDSSTLSGSYLLLGTIPFPARIIKIVNESTVPVTISYNGTTDQDIVSSGGFTLYDFGTNRGTSANGMDLPAASVYAKGAVGTGLIYLVSASALSPPMNIPGV